MSKINILIIDDSNIVHLLLEKVISHDDEITIIGNAYNGKEGVDLVKKLSPDVIIMDISMPMMSGLDAIQEIMNIKPTPIIVFSSPGKDSVDTSFKAIELGAVEIIEKPYSEDLSDLKKQIEDRIIRSIKTFADFKVVRRIKRNIIYTVNEKKTIPDSKNLKHRINDLDNIKIKKDLNDFLIIGIAASTGGPQTIKILFQTLALKKIEAGFVIVQHIADGFIEGFCDWLSLYTDKPVIVPKNGESIKPNTIYVAPEKYHLVFDNKEHFQYIDSPPIFGIRPSADMMFESLGRVFKNRVIGIVLTGMGNDGSKGIIEIKKNGGYIISQDEDSSVIYGMPKSALETGVVDKVLSIYEIASFLENKYINRVSV